jgi:serine phosphatase RsbU (regulator of sigma subunit)
MSSPSPCLLCALPLEPKGTTVFDRFHCSTCSKEWILEKRKKKRFPKRLKSLEFRDLLSEFITIYDSELDLDELCFNTLAIIKSKLGVSQLGFLIYDEINEYVKFIKYFSENSKLETFITKIKIGIKDNTHPYIESIQNREISLYEVDKKNRHLKLYNKITGTKYQILVPVIHKDKFLGLFCLDFKNKKDASRVFELKELIKLISVEFGVALHHTLSYTIANTKYRQFVSLHSSGLTLNKLYLNNTNEIIKMSLLTISGIVETDINILLVFNTKFKVLTSHKLIRTRTTFDFLQESLIIENYQDHRHYFDKLVPEIINTENESTANGLGFLGREILNLPSFKIENNEYVFLLGRTSTLLFTPDEVEVLAAYTELVKMTIENAFLYHKMTKQERLEKEVEIAKEIQFNLLPSKMPSHEDYESAGFMIPAREIGGDYYDILVSPDKKESLFAIGDVSGKGLPAGMVMVTARTIIHSVIRRMSKLSEIIRELNSYLYYNYKNSASTRFMSIICLLWSKEKNRFEYIGGGHGNLLVYKSKTKTIESIFTGGTILGILPDISHTITEGSIELEEGDSILLYTDGVTESMNPKGEMFEESRLADSLKEHAHLESEQILSEIYSDIKNFTSNSISQHDDITMLLIKRKSNV